MNEFKFTIAQRKALCLNLNKYPEEQREVFLNVTQRIICEWMTDYPTRSCDNKKSRESIEKLATQIDKARGYMQLLTDDARNHLGAFWKHGYRQKGWPANINEIQHLLFELNRCTTDLIQPGGISKSIERDIAERLAWGFVDTFKERPTTSPDGPFMSYIKHLSENILIPQGREIVFGKDLIASVLKHVRKRCDELDKFMKS